ncbi:MAG: cellulase family glycosylhydrolase [Verrucomicrobiales bacterium]|nr:cellulase family glycosylhydrolase [Verrucomicrobiales bacterium]
MFSRILGSLAVATALLGLTAVAAELPGRWPADKANAWLDRTGWLVGCNYAPAYAINQLEMWQPDTFDPAAIDRELALAEGLGFNSLRVFLHDLAWRSDPKGFLRRVDQFLDIAKRHRIGVVLVLFDAVWDPFPKAGPQRAPRPHVHNSGWIQSPGAEILGDAARHDELKPYVQAVLKKFRRDKRIQAWDLFNEPDNPNTSAYGSVELKNKAEMALRLLEKTWTWAREVRPSQPLTSGVWVGQWADPAQLNAMERFQLENSDVISFHNYSKLEDLQACVRNLRRYGRPLLCTEYMARPAGSTFEPHLGWMKSEKVAAHNWGFVAGKTQTQYPWDSWKSTYTAEPPVWFHEIFRADGSPYRPEEVRYIRQVTGHP